MKKSASVYSQLNYAKKNFDWLKAVITWRTTANQIDLFRNRVLNQEIFVKKFTHFWLSLALVILLGHYLIGTESSRKTRLLWVTLYIGILSTRRYRKVTFSCQIGIFRLLTPPFSSVTWIRTQGVNCDGSSRQTTSDYLDTQFSG